MHAAYFRKDNKFIPIPYGEMESLLGEYRGYKNPFAEGYPNHVVRRHREHFIRAYDYKTDKSLWIFSGNLSWWQKLRLRIKATKSHWLQFVAATVAIIVIALMLGAFLAIVLIFNWLF